MMRKVLKFAFLIALSLVLAFFLSSWGNDAVYLTYIPKFPDDPRGVIFEVLVLLILYCPLIYLVWLLKAKV